MTHATGKLNLELPASITGFSKDSESADSSTIIKDYALKQIR